MAKKGILVDLDFNQNEVQNAVIQNLASAPASPKSGQHYFNTTDHKEYVYNGTSWVETTNQGEILTFTSPLVKTGTTVTINASSNTGSGAIRIATDAEATAGTSELLAVNPKQLATKVTANAAITGATKCKITYDTKGLVTAGADLAESDIPSLHLSKISDVTATAAEVNVLDGITASTAELNILDGVTASTTELNYVDGVTSAIQTQIDNKVTKNANITAGTATKITYDAKGLVTGGASLVASDIPDISATYVPQTSVGVANGVASLGADGKVPSSQLPSYVDDVIELNTLAASAPATCATGDKYYNTTTKLIYTATATDTWGTTGETPDSGVIYVAKDTNASYRWSGSDMINIANPISAATESTPGIAAIATQAEVTAGSNDTKFVTPLKLATALSGNAFKETATNPALTASGGVCTWTISTSKAPGCIVAVYETSGGAEVLCDVTHGGGSLTIKINSSSNISAGFYTAVVIG